MCCRLPRRLIRMTVATPSGHECITTAEESGGQGQSRSVQLNRALPSSTALQVLISEKGPNSYFDVTWLKQRGRLAQPHFADFMSVDVPASCNFVQMLQACWDTRLFFAQVKHGLKQNVQMSLSQPFAVSEWPRG